MSSVEKVIDDCASPSPGGEATLLVIDDDLSVQRGLRRYFKYKYKVITASSASQGLSALAENTVHCIILDIKMKGATGFDVYHRLKEIRPGIPIIFYTGFQNEHDIKSILNQYNPHGYFGKGESITDVEAAIEAAVDQFKERIQGETRTNRLARALREEKAYASRLKDRINPRYAFDALRGASPQMAELRELCRKAARSDITVLIHGETGTGKELVANIIHSNSRRQDKLFLVQNCAAIPDHLFESIFFGHKKGAFTGAISDRQGVFDLADKGTVFLDEVGDLSLPMQAKLLRLLQEGEIQPVGSNTHEHVDVRIISATNKQLENEVKAGNFRADLYYRLGVFSISPPPLRRIPSDIPLLARFILDKYNRKNKTAIDAFSDEVMAALTEARFPGNVRQLENEIERAMVMAGPSARILELRHFSAYLAPDGCGLADVRGRSLKEKVASFETRLIRDTLQRHRGNKTLAAKTLGISRVGLNNKIKRYGIATEN